MGSSAGIFGLIGAMLAFGFTDRSSLGMQVKSLYTRWVIYGLVLSFIPGVDILGAHWRNRGRISGRVAGQHAAGAPDVEGTAAAGSGRGMYCANGGGVRDDVIADDRQSSPRRSSKVLFCTRTLSPTTGHTGRAPAPRNHPARLIFQ